MYYILLYEVINGKVPGNSFKTFTANVFPHKDEFIITDETMYRVTAVTINYDDKTVHLFVTKER